MKRTIRLLALPFLRPAFSRLDILVLMVVVWFVSTSSSVWTSVVALVIGMAGTGLVTMPSSWLLRRVDRDEP